MAGPLDDQRVGAVTDRAEGLAPKNRKRGPHEVLDHVESRPEQILVDDRLARPRL